MNSFQFAIVYLLAGLVIGLILFILRSAIDQRRGALAEVAAVHLPIFVAATIVALVGNYDGYVSFGRRIAPSVELVFLALPVFVLTRLTERLSRGESWQIADLFRITTVVSLSLFVSTSLLDSIDAVGVLAVSLIYLAGETAAYSSRVGRNLAIVFSLSFVVAILGEVIGAQSILAVVEFTDLLRGGGQMSSLRYDGAFFSLPAFIAAIAITPALIQIWLRNATWLHRFALRVSVLRFAVGNPAEMIFVRPLMNLWYFPPGVCYLNHGSFGAVPLTLRDVQQGLRAECENEPMDFLSRQAETRWLEARFQLATWLGTQADNIAFCENATSAMNEIAHWFPLQTDDEVLLNDHEYGAVRRIWQRKCESAGASLVTATLPLPFLSRKQISEAILGRVSRRTKLVVLSHITSPTAVILPVEDLCASLQERGIATCIDGPHAILQEQVKLSRLNCDFYTASCHKWLCAPLGSGFVYVAPKWHAQIKTSRLSWGRLQPGSPTSWSDEMLWTGTRDFSAYLTVPHAIRFFERFQQQKLDERNHALACFARERLCSLAGTEPVTPAGREWFGWFVAVWLPAGDHATLQQRLWSGYKIEVPIVRFRDRYLVRVSCHLYNSTHDIDYLARALRKELAVSPKQA